MLFYGSGIFIKLFTQCINCLIGYTSVINGLLFTYTCYGCNIVVEFHKKPLVLLRAVMYSFYIALY